MEKYINQLSETVQFYFGKRGIKEVVDFKYNVPGAGRLLVELHTKELLRYEDLSFIEKLVFALMPIGIMYEFVNVAVSPTNQEQKIIPDGFEMTYSVPPLTENEPTDTMLPGRKKKNK